MSRGDARCKLTFVTSVTEPGLGMKVPTGAVSLGPRVAKARSHPNKGGGVTRH